MPCAAPSGAASSRFSPPSTWSATGGASPARRRPGPSSVGHPDKRTAGNSELYERLSNGDGNETQLETVESGQPAAAIDWSRDGRFLMYAVVGPRAANDLWVRPMDRGAKPFVFLSTDADERPGQLSPDGRWVAYQSNQSGPFENDVRPFPAGPGGQWQISASGGTQPRWESGRQGAVLHCARWTTDGGSP